MTRLYHPRYGFLTMAPETLAPNQWTNEYGVRYGTFLTESDRLFVILPMASVDVLTV